MYYFKKYLKIGNLMPKKILLIGKRNYLLDKSQKKFSTQYGELDLTKAKVGKKIKTHLGESFNVVEPRSVDLLRKIKRAPQVIMAKDAGLITAFTGLTKKDVVVEAGAGSGMLTIFLAGIVKKVHSYEIRKDFYDVVKGNLEKCSVKNVELKNQDVGKCKEKDVDVFILDMGSPEEHVKTAHKALKPGGFLVVYSPVIEQVLRLRLEGFSSIETRECILRNWDVGNNKTRPRTRMLGHTGFVTFARKI